MQVEPGDNDATMEKVLDFADKKREVALIRLAQLQAKLDQTEVQLADSKRISNW